MIPLRKQGLYVVRDDEIVIEKVSIRKEIFARIKANRKKILLLFSCFLLASIVLSFAAFSKKEEVRPKTVTIKDILPSVKKGSKFSVEQIRDYLCAGNFIKLAVNASNKIGCPPSVLIAQNILESNLGQSKLTIKTNNQGNVKCPNSHNHSKCKRSPACIRAKDLVEGSNDYYQSVRTSWESWRLKLNCLIKYNDIKKCQAGRLDYKSWAYAFHQSPYATDVNYDAKLINIIEAYGLNRLDSIIESTSITTYSGKYVVFSPRK
jgi:hypothetical protein